MKVSVNELKKYTKVDLSIDELVQKIGAQLGAVEEVIDLGQKYQGILIVKVMTCGRHPNADKLSVCKIDDDGAAKNVQRDESGYVQVVCGAPNVREGMFATWLPPGSTVPATFDKDPFVLEARELRGEISNGMLASAQELAFNDDHSGILEISSEKVNPGDDFAGYFGLNDYIIDIENKMFTHRPDLFGLLGIAREVAGIQRIPFHSPSWYVKIDQRYFSEDPDDPELAEPGNNHLTLEIVNGLPELVPRFTAITMSNIVIETSPLWLQIYLIKHGSKPINNIVDLTNYYMHLTGQPLHAYDYDKLAKSIEVRKSRKGDALTLLNGKEITFEDDSDILITSADKPIGIGGVMGGSETEVDDTTKNIVLECATFDMYSIRRTSMKHGLFTDAVTRFSKGQSPLQAATVLTQIVNDIRDNKYGVVASELVDIDHTEQYYVKQHKPGIVVEPSFINERLGLNLKGKEIGELLVNVEFDDLSLQPDAEIELAVPFWRTDIEIPEDIVEEIGRLHGYDHLLLDMPKRGMMPAGPDNLLKLKSQLRRKLAKLGTNEVSTYSFLHGNLLDKANQDKEKAYKLANALSPDLQYYRMSLTPSLLDKVHMNSKVGYDEFALFEIGKAHIRGEQDAFEPHVPKEVNSLAFVYAQADKIKNRSGAAYYTAHSYLEELLRSFNVVDEIVLEPLQQADLYKNPWLEQMTAPYEPSRSAVLRDGKGLIWGVVGEFRSILQKVLKLPVYTAGFELDPLLFLRGRGTHTYTPLSRFPSVTQDICLQIDEKVPYGELTRAFEGALKAGLSKDEIIEFHPIDIYGSDKLAGQKRITYRVALTSYERTLNDTRAGKLLDQTATSLEKSHHTQRI